MSAPAHFSSLLPDLIRQSMIAVVLVPLRGAMRAFVLALWLALAVRPTLAETIAPADAQAHVGQFATVEGIVSEVHTDARSMVTFINIDGRHPNELFTGVIFKDDASKFSNVDTLVGKVVDITGRIQLYKGRVEIILNDPAQLKIK